MPLPARARRSSQIAELIVQQIQSGTLKVGDRLPTETTLCKTHNVSRTTLREAIQMLRTQGLLDVTPGRGSFIRPPDTNRWMHELLHACKLSDILPHHITHLRQLLQSNVVRDLAKAGKAILLSHPLLHPAHDAATNAAHEQTWCTAMATHTENPLQTMLVEALARLDFPAMQARFNNPKHLTRAITLQQEIHHALHLQAWHKAEHALAHYFAPLPANQLQEAEQTNLRPEPIKLPQSA